MCEAVLKIGFPEPWVGVNVRVGSVCGAVLKIRFPEPGVGVSVRVGSVCVRPC